MTPVVISLAIEVFCHILDGNPDQWQQTNMWEYMGPAAQLKTVVTPVIGLSVSL